MDNKSQPPAGPAVFWSVPERQTKEELGTDGDRIYLETYIDIGNPGFLAVPGSFPQGTT